eukprot:3058781-Pleurochrysis_carterae.AAC.1
MKELGMDSTTGGAFDGWPGVRVCAARGAARAASPRPSVSSPQLRALARPSVISGSISVAKRVAACSRRSAESESTCRATPSSACQSTRADSVPSPCTASCRSVSRASAESPACEHSSKTDNCDSRSTRDASSSTLAVTALAGCRRGCSCVTRQQNGSCCMEAASTGCSPPVGGADRQLSSISVALPMLRDPRANTYSPAEREQSENVVVVEGVGAFVSFKPQTDRTTQDRRSERGVKGEASCTVLWRKSRIKSDGTQGYDVTKGAQVRGHAEASGPPLWPQVREAAAGGERGRRVCGLAPGEVDDEAAAV